MDPACVGADVPWALTAIHLGDFITALLLILPGLLHKGCRVKLGSWCKCGPQFVTEQGWDHGQGR